MTRILSEKLGIDEAQAVVLGYAIAWPRFGLNNIAEAEELPYEKIQEAAQSLLSKNWLVVEPSSGEYTFNHNIPEAKSIRSLYHAAIAEEARNGAQ